MKTIERMTHDKGEPMRVFSAKDKTAATNTVQSTSEATKDVTAILKILRKRKGFVATTSQAQVYRTVLMCLDAMYPGNTDEVNRDLKKPVYKANGKGSAVKFVPFTVQSHPDVYQVVEGCTSCTPAQKKWYEAYARKGEPLRVFQTGKKLSSKTLVEKYAQDKDEMLRSLFSLVDFTESERLDIEQESAEEIGARLFVALGQEAAQANT